MSMSIVARRRHPIRGLIGGLLLGLGASILAVVYAKLPMGETTPLVVLGASLVIGLVVGLFGPARKKKETRAPTRT